MNGRKFIELLEHTYPFSMAEDWDNPGLQVGRRDREVKKVYIGLDATDQVIDEAISFGADLLLTHHPLLMSPLRQVNSDTFIGKRVMKLIRHDISCYAIHTNHDVVTMGALAARVLNLTEARVLEVTKGPEITGKEEGIGRVGKLNAGQTLEECAHRVKKAFGLDSVKIFGDPQTFILTAAISPGSGKSMIGPALQSNAQVLITGDIGHHEGIDAAAQGLCIIDAGHYGLEHIFIEQMAGFLKTAEPDLKIRKETIKNPFQVL